MGSGRFDTKVYAAAASTYKTQSRASLFRSSIFPDFNPLQIKFRESCASAEHPHPTSIIIACDVTGSMGKIPEDLLKGELGKIMESLSKIQAISNPQVMFAAIGDTEYDQAPLQITQFESDNRIESQLKSLYLEGGGGGNNTESYQVIWYFAARKTQLDSWKEGKKGILFTMGDEMIPTVLTAGHIKKFIDKEYNGPDIPTSQLIKEVSEKYDVFHLIVQDGSGYKNIGPANVNSSWQQYLNERAILVPNHTEIPEKIIAMVKSLSELNVRNSKPTEKSTLTSAEITTKVGVFSLKLSGIPSAASQLNKDSEGVPHLFICPISQEVMEDPVMAEDGYTYDRKSISKWLQKNNTSPITNNIIGKLLIDNNSLKSEIKQWQENAAAKSRGLANCN